MPSKGVKQIFPLNLNEIQKSSMSMNYRQPTLIVVPMNKQKAANETFIKLENFQVKTRHFAQTLKLKSNDIGFLSLEIG